MRPLFWLSTIAQKSQQSASKGACPCLLWDRSVFNALFTEIVLFSKYQTQTLLQTDFLRCVYLITLLQAWNISSFTLVFGKMLWYFWWILKQFSIYMVLIMEISRKTDNNLENFRIEYWSMWSGLDTYAPWDAVVFRRNVRIFYFVGKWRQFSTRELLAL